MRTYIIKETYVDKDEPWSGILDAAAFIIISTENRSKGSSPGQLVLGRDMILPIKYTMEWEFIRQKNQTQINKDNTQKIVKQLTMNTKLEIKSCLIIIML